MTKKMKTQNMLFFLLVSLLGVSLANPWGTLKPNLFFALKERSKHENVLGLAWMVKDWRTNQLLVRHALSYGNPSENVKAVYKSHDGENFARQTITDSDYNVRFQVDFIQVTDDAAEEEKSDIELDWYVSVKIEAIDAERSVKVVPFLYLRKDQSLDAVPYGITLDKEELDDGGKVQIHGVKVVQKTLDSEQSF